MAAQSTLETYNRQSVAYREHTDSKWRRGIDESSFLPLFGDLCGQVILDVGSGAGRWTREALHLGARTVYALEPSSKMAALAKAMERALNFDDVRHIEADILEYDCSSLTVDTVIMGYVLHHLARRDQVLAALKNVYSSLKPGGRLIAANACLEAGIPQAIVCENPKVSLVLPESNVEWCKGHIFMEPAFETDFIVQRRQTICDLLKEAGFKNVQLAATKCDSEALSAMDEERRKSFDDFLSTFAFFAANK